ncbi:MAG: D-Ala-D-Ala carboxypeptidase family metallohydrolase [Oceanicaulis sp.]
MPLATRTPLLAAASALALAACDDGDDAASRSESGTALATEGPYTLAAAERTEGVTGYSPAARSERGGAAGAAGKEVSAARDVSSAHTEILDAGDPVEADWLPVSIDGTEAPYPVWHHTILPGDTIELSADQPFALSLNGEIIAEEAGSHSWTAPREPGNHTIRAFTTEGEVQRITVFVMTPREEGQTVIEGYRIGTYPENPPPGFIRLTQDDMDLPVSPNFVIGQFICKQQPGHWPKFILTSGPMLERLELLLASLREDGRTDAETFFVMSGFRTPFYNSAIGSSRLSRHMYGDAADIYPDVEGNDSVMDDLNNDGRITREDAEWLYDYAEELYANSDEVIPGGIGAYGASAVHGPFVHIDGRGRAARWGRHGS